jgi:DnaJ homolog subfamily C member 1
MAEVGRAYRKKSMLLQCIFSPSFFCLTILTPGCSPDKNPGVKGAQERFARLGVVASILRSQDGRERSAYRIYSVTKPDTLL